MLFDWLLEDELLLFGFSVVACELLAVGFCSLSVCSAFWSSVLVSSGFVSSCVDGELSVLELLATIPDSLGWLALIIVTVPAVPPATTATALAPMPIFTARFIPLIVVSIEVKFIIYYNSLI